MGEPGLAHPRVTDDGHQSASRTGHGLFECGSDRREFVRPSHQGRVEAPGEDLGAGLHDGQPIGGQGFGLSLHREGLQRFGDHGCPDQPVGGFAEEDLTGLGRLLQPGCDVHRVARYERLPRRGIGRHDLPRIHPDAGPDPGSPPALELHVQGVQRRLHVDRRADRPEGVVLMNLRNAEHRHHGVADELLDRPAVAFDHRAHLGEVALDDLAERLGVELLAQRGRARDVAEQDGDRLSGRGHAPAIRPGRTS